MKKRFMAILFVAILCLGLLPVQAEKRCLYEQNFEIAASESNGWSFKSASGSESYAEITADIKSGGSRALKIVSKTKSSTNDILSFDFGDIAFPDSDKLEILFEFRIESFTRDFWRFGVLESDEAETGIYFRSSGNYACWQQKWTKYFALGTQYQCLKYVLDADGTFEVYRNGVLFESGTGMRDFTKLSFKTRDGSNWGSGNFNSDVDMIYWIDNVSVRKIPSFSATLSDENGMAVGKLENCTGKTIYVEAFADAEKYLDDNYIMIFALKSNGKLIDISCKKNKSVAAFNLPENLDENCQVEAYLWEEKSLRPLEKQITLGKTPLNKIEYFVSLSGTSNGTGTIEDPFDSWEKAQSAIQRLKNRDAYPDGGVTVSFREGVYHTNGITLTDKDSGTASAPVTWRAYPGENVSFTGGNKISNQAFSVSDDPRIPENALGKVYVCSLTELDIEDYGSLPVTGHSQYYLNLKGWGGGGYYPLIIVGDKMLQIARYPNKEDGFAKIGTIYNYGSVGNKNEDPDAQMTGMSFSIATINSERIERWAKAATEGELWAFGYWFYDWSDLTTPIASIDTLNKSLTTELASPMGATGIRHGQSYYVYNLLEELDAPGEWYYDKKSGDLFLYLPQGETIEDANIEVVFKRKTLLSVSNAANIVVQGITFENVRGDAVTVSNCENVLLESCCVKNASGNGIGLNGTGLKIKYCTVEHVGARGIGVSGGDKNLLISAENVVSDCVVNDFAMLIKTMTPGIYVDGVGQTVRNCLIENGPQIGLRFGGNDHLIEGNIVRDVMKESSDGGAIYAGQSTTSRGTVVRQNAIIDIASDRETGNGIYGMYLDGRFSGTTVTDNVFKNIGNSVIGGTAVFNHGGRNNTITKNTIVNVKNGIQFSGVVDKIASEDTSEQENIVNNPAYVKYPNFVNMLNDDYFEPKYCIIRDNMVFDVDTPLNVTTGSRPITKEWIYQNNELQEPNTTEGFVFDISMFGPRQ